MAQYQQQQQFQPQQMTRGDEPIVISTQFHPGVGLAPGTKDWSSGILGVCNDVEVFFCVTCFGCIYACRLATALGESCCVPTFAGIIPLRLKLRMMLGIRGSICDDTLCVCCLGSCTLCQMAREMKNAGMM